LTFQFVRLEYRLTIALDLMRDDVIDRQTNFMLVGLFCVSFISIVE